jgi:nitrogen-specific signal transduction histidine kinase
MAADNIANAVSRTRLELERARLEASLHHARRMETVGALTSGVAHNFNNVIGAILGHTEMQEAEVHPETRLAQHVKGVRQAAERARDLVEQILNFGRRKEPSEQRVSLSLLLAETEMQLRVALPREVNLLVSCTSNGAAVHGDPAQLQQIIMNLCNNASQAMGGAGTIRVVVDVRFVSEPLMLSHASLTAGSYVRIVVTDTGCGMTAETLKRLFEPFFTTRSQGNGLGLATAYDIVAGYDGGINVSTALGQGSTFEVWLPLAASNATSPPGQARALAPGGGETVLVINEDAGRLLHDEELIAALGYEPVGYPEAACAAAACRSEPERFDVLLISNVQPAAKALALATELYAASRALPIILAAASDDLSADTLAVAGVCEVVKTPLTSAELACALPRWVSARQLSPS